MKTEERITKSTDREPGAGPANPGRRGRGPFALVMMALVLAAALVATYNYYLLHHATTEGEIADIESLIVAGKTEDAVALLAGAQERSADVAALRLRVGRAFLREGHAGPATALLSKVQGSLIKEEQLAIAEYFLGAGDPYSATRFFEGAMASGQPRTAALLDRYAQALSLAGNGAPAAAAFRECLALDPSRAGVRLNLAATLANLGQLEEARREVLGALETDPEDSRALRLLAALGEVR